MSYGGVVGYRGVGYGGVGYRGVFYGGGGGGVLHEGWVMEGLSRGDLLRCYSTIFGHTFCFELSRIYLRITNDIIASIASAPYK